MKILFNHGLFHALVILAVSLSSAFGGGSDNWKEEIPVPVFKQDPALVQLYWKAWELAHQHVKEQPGLPQSPYMDEGFWNDTIWIWDTCFMSLFCKYAPHNFPGVESLNNFYVPLDDPHYQPGTYPLNIQHPDNPPLFAWVEYENFAFTGDTNHLADLLGKTKYLQKHFEWFDALTPGWQFKSANTVRKRSAPVALSKTENGYRWGGIQSGMDNTPRRHGLWVDAITQQGLSALYISRLAEQIGQHETAVTWRAKYDAIKEKVNRLYWDEADGIYYDIDPQTLAHLKVKTPASYWPMLAEMCSPQQAARMVEHIRDTNTFGGERPWVTVARNDPAFTPPDGDYWRGAIWLPTAYMATKALEKYGYYADADAAAEKLLYEMLRTYENCNPHTVWECYSPMRDTPANHGGVCVRPDFCGWSALGPICLFIENVLGFNVVDAQKKRVEWRLHHAGEQGLRNLTFGSVHTDIVFDGKATVQVDSNARYTLVINGVEHPIKAGKTKLGIVEVK